MYCRCGKRTNCPATSSPTPTRPFITNFRPRSGGTKTCFSCCHGFSGGARNGADQRRTAAAADPQKCAVIQKGQNVLNTNACTTPNQAAAPITQTAPGISQCHASRCLAGGTGRRSQNVPAKIAA